MTTARAVADAFAGAPLCFLATSLQGVPNVVPIGFKWVEDGRLLMADLFLGKTRAGLSANPRIAVAVGLLDPKRGFQARGIATVHRSGPKYDRVAALLRAQGVEAALHAAIELELNEVYAVDPGAEAGKRVA